MIFTAQYLAESIQMLQQPAHPAPNRFRKTGPSAALPGTERFLTQQGVA